MTNTLFQGEFLWWALILTEEVLQIEQFWFWLFHGCQIKISIETSATVWYLCACFLQTILLADQTLWKWHVRIRITFKHNLLLFHASCWAGLCMYPLHGTYSYKYRANELQNKLTTISCGNSMRYSSTSYLVLLYSFIKKQPSLDNCKKSLE